MSKPVQTLIPLSIFAGVLAGWSVASAQAAADYVPPMSRPSFDCQRAQTPVERFLCSPDGDAWAAPYDDRDLAPVYRAALSRVRDKAALVASERRWLKARGAGCDIPLEDSDVQADAAVRASRCLSQQYESRLRDLQLMAGSASVQARSPRPSSN